MLQQLKASSALELLFVCAKAKVAPVSQAATDCLVLIWQWYLRKSPSASFSDSQIGSFLGSDFSNAETSPIAAAPSASDTHSPHRLAANPAQELIEAPRLAAASAQAAPLPGNTVLQANSCDDMSHDPDNYEQQQQHNDWHHESAVQAGISPLWSVTPVVDFVGGPQEGSVQSTAVPALAPVTPPAPQDTIQAPSGTPDGQADLVCIVMRSTVKGILMRCFLVSPIYA